MVLANNLFWGWLLAFIGMAIPGLANMTTANVSIRYGIRAGLISAAGAALVIFFQAKLAVAFASYLSTHAEVLTTLKKVAVLIFLVLGVVFFYQALKPRVRSGGKSYPGTPFLKGFAASGMNVLNIPFYFTASAYLEANNYLLLRPFSGWGVAAGAAIGAFCILAVYAYLAQILTRKAPVIDRNLNFFLSALFLVLAMVQWALLYFV